MAIKKSEERNKPNKPVRVSIQKLKDVYLVCKTTHQNKRVVTIFRRKKFSTLEEAKDAAKKLRRSISKGKLK